MAINKSTTGAIYGPVSSTTMTGEAMTSGAGSLYQITTTAHRVIDPNASYALNSTAQAMIDTTYYDNGWNLFTGQVKLTAATAVISVTGSYLTLATMGSFISWSLSEKEVIADTTAIGDSWKGTTAIIDAFTLTLKRFYIDSTFWGYISAANSFIFQIWEDAVTGYWCRGFQTSESPSFAVDKVDEESLSFQLTGPVTRF